MKKRILCICLVALSCIHFAGCGATDISKDSTEKNESGIVKEALTEPEQTTENNQTEPQGDDEPMVYYIDAEYVQEENLCPADEVVEWEGIEYQVESAVITKEFGNRNKETLGDFFETDENGNLICDSTYFFLTVTYTNKTDKNIEFDRSAGDIVAIASDMEVWNCSEVFYIDEYWTGGDPSGVLRYELEPGESITSEVGFGVDDCMLETEGYKFYFHIGYPNEYSDGTKYISLEE